MLASFLLAITAQYTCKLSILLFYRRIFSASAFHKNTSLYVMLFASAWFLATAIATLSICRPLRLIWYPEQQTKSRKCGKWPYMIFMLLITDALIDLAVLLIPIRTAFTLQLPKRAKVGLAGVFALGGFVVLTNVVRIAGIVHRKDPDESTFFSSSVHMSSRDSWWCLLTKASFSS
jgi:hypothetical protein